MRRLHAVLATVAALAMAPMVAWAAPGDGLLGTAHDFTVGAMDNTVPNAYLDPDGGAQSQVGLCTFCHTPHKAQTTKLLWNHTLSSNSFAWDDSETTAGTTLPTLDGPTYNGVSTKCLSCHDGSVAVGDVAWFWEMGRDEAGGNQLNTFHVGSDETTFLIGSGGDMSGNHPVGVPYPFGNVANTYNTITTGSQAILTEWQADPSSGSNVRLFHDTGSAKAAGASAGTTGIECSSCHDPHNKQAVDDLFLRGNLIGSTQADGYICLQCHIK